jgi:SHS2 domain-containing protein
MSGRGGFEFLDDVTSDLTFEAHGATAAELFTAAADALLAATVEQPDAVRERVERRVELTDERLDWLLRRFLSELVYLRDADRLLLRAREVEIAGEGVIDGDGEIRLSATFAGEPFDLSRHTPANEVKAITAYGLSARRDPDGVWRARVTFDV